MTENYLMSLDIGGSGGRCMLVKPETGEITVATRAWRHPANPKAGVWSFDLDTDLIWSLLGEAIGVVCARANVRAEQIAAIAVTGMRHGLVVVDAQGNPLMTHANIDARAVEQSMILAGEYGEVLYERSGHWPAPINGAPVLLWMKEHSPEAMLDASAVLSVSDWVAYRLTGELVFEATQAAETTLFDLRSGDWAADLIVEFGLRREIFPRLVTAGERLGALLAGAAAQLGLEAGIPVVVGGADTQSGMLGVGALAPGQLGVIAGTTAPIQLVSDKALIDPEKRLWTSVHLVRGRYVLESNAGAMGNSLEWIAGALYPGLPDPVPALLAEAASAPAGASGVISTLGASLFNASDLSLPVDNFSFSTANRQPSDGERSFLVRAVVEGLAYSVRANIEQIQRVGGDDVMTIYVGGGLARSQSWAKLLSQVTGVEVKIPKITQVSALGAAICAGVGVGLYDDLESGANSLVRYTHHHNPDPAEHELYQSRYQDWMDLHQERVGYDALAASIFTQSMESAQTDGGTQRGDQFRPRIYVSADMGAEALVALREIGDVTYASYREGALLVGEELVEKLDGYHIFVTEVDILDAEALRELPDLRMVAACRGKPVNVDIAACTAAGVPVVNTPGRNANAVADLALSLMLMLARRLGEAANFLRQPGGEAGDMGRMGQAYFQYQGVELWGKTVGVIGAGAIGGRVVERLLPFQAQILVYDPFIDAGSAALFGAKKVELNELLDSCDFISLHAPVNDDTRAMIDAAAFERMKPGAFLINTARAALVDDKALVAALESGKLGGAALDVFSVEPPGSDDPLLAFPNVIATPHLGGNTREVGEHQGRIVAGELKLLLAGETPQHILNPETLEGFSWTGERRISLDILEEFAGGLAPGVSDLHAEDALESERSEKDVIPERKGGLLNRLFKRVEEDEKAQRFPIPVAADAAQRETMIRILESFTANVAADPKMAQASKGKDVAMHFTIRDLDQVFHLYFQDGRVDAGLGEPPVEPHVRLKMSADILDGMFTGRISGNKAAMTGKLSFSGDTRKAMAFQRFSRDMERLYQAAREQVGDPGDLTQLGKTPVRAATPESATQADSYTAPAVIKVGDVRDEILQVTNELYARGLITATGGNVSARTDDDPEQAWITPSAIFKGDLRPGMMVRIDLHGNLIGDSDYGASSERRVHCAIYRARPDINAVIHTHAPQATIMALTGTKFLPISTEAAFVGDVPVVPFIMPGTDELGDEVARALGEGVAVIMANHGLVVAGSSPRRASDMTEIVESTAHKILTSKALGVEPELLPDDALDELREIGRMLV